MVSALNDWRYDASKVQQAKNCYYRSPISISGCLWNALAVYWLLKDMNVHGTRIKRHETPMPKVRGLEERS